MPLDPLFFIRMRRALGLRPQRSALFYIKHERASPSTPFLFRRRSHENSARDVLRQDARLFEVEPLTKRSQGEALLSAAATG